MKRILLLFILLPVILIAQTESNTRSGIDFTTLLTAFIGAIIGGAFTIVGGYFQNKFASRSQLEQYQRTIRVENKKEWIYNLQNYVAEYTGLLLENDLMNFYYFRIFLPKLNNNSEEYNKAFEDYTKESKKNSNLSNVLSTKIITLINLKDETQKELYDKIIDLGNCITNPIPDANEDMNQSNIKLNKTVNEVRFILSKLIQEERSKLNEFESS